MYVSGYLFYREKPGGSDSSDPMNNIISGEISVKTVLKFLPAGLAVPVW
jgi:hypothetical protein